MNGVTPGLERFLADPPENARGGRIGVLTNPSGIDRLLRSTVDLLIDHPKLHVTALFGPEHGVRGEAQAGEHVGGRVDCQTGLPVHSLYGENRAPTAEMLNDIDIMVIDLQDIGVRYATYLSTVALAIDACSVHKKQVIVLDRPNPLGGNRLAGNIVEPAFASFVGIHPIPILHGLTIGEFGKRWARDHQLDQPIVVTMDGWNREMWFDQTGLPWAPPSPNLPTLDSVTLYPATCLVEGTILSEGRGTTRPFEIVGAPWIVPRDLANSLASIGLDGIGFRPLSFTPIFSKHRGERCGGVQMYVHNREEFDAVAFGPRLLATIQGLYPGLFAWLPPTDDDYFIDKLAGSSSLRTTIDAGGSIDELLDHWRIQSDDFGASRADILLY
jgi:uncharacterized protein YbbC (DUF1343 family)